MEQISLYSTQIHEIHKAILLLFTPSFSAILTICRKNMIHILDGSVDWTLVTTNNMLSIL